MRFADRTCEEFVEILAGKSPVPGGGGASALAGAIGMALGSMVVSLTVGKKKYAEVETEFRELQHRADEMQKNLLEMMDRDAEAFEPLSKAYAMPKDTPKELAEKDRVMEKCLVTAAEVPLEIMKLCCECIDMVSVIAEKGSRLALSDAGAAAAVLRGALEGASLNIFINAASMKDMEKADKLKAEAGRMLEEYSQKAEEIFSSVRSRLENRD
ncbi:MAG: cyclodeaminase/cyclohydrolase family protein [Clostridia bacterium]|nr:cyclodeaminase/cyclohydrolase family protein [Clostridia bacterium]